MSVMLKFLKDYWPSAIVIAVILYATFSSDPIVADSLPVFPHADKLIHSIMMGGLVGAVAFDYQRARKPVRSLDRRVMLAVTLGVMVFGVADELVQGALDNSRSSDFYDVLADWVGSWVAFFSAPPAIYGVLRIRQE